jgi:hypothetical protein
MDVAPEPGRAVIRVVGQTLLAVCAPFTFAGLFDTQGGTFDPLVWKWDWFENICIRIACWGFPLLVGAAMAHAGPRARAAARWVWIVPTALWVFAVLSDSARWGWDIRRIVRAYLTEKEDVEGIGLFFSFVAWSCLMYSIGAAVGSRVVLRLSAGRTPPDNRPKAV